jgi:hypothetical protein
MARHARAITAAELRVAHSRRDLRDGWRRLRRRFSQPSSLAAAAAVGALLGFSLTRRGRTGSVARPLVTALIRLGMEHLVMSGKKSPERGALPGRVPGVS